MLLHLADYFDASTYHEHYNGHLDRIKSYLLMERKYVYTLYAADINRSIHHFASSAAGRWLQKLCQYYEFRHVHESQRRFYPEFAQLVDGFIEKTQITGWMLDTYNQDKTKP